MLSLTTMAGVASAASSGPKTRPFRNAMRAVRK
jgi:hypothetical protein